MKFNDIDLIGFPLRVVVGARGLEKGEVELSLRADGLKRQVLRPDAVAEVERTLATLCSGA